MDTYVQEIANFLQDRGHGVVGTSIFMGILPPMPDYAVQVLDYGGDDPSFMMGETISGAIEQPRFQVMVRSESGLQARTVAAAIWRDLASICNEDVHGTYYLRVAPRMSPFMVENDDAERTRIVCNYEAARAVA